MYILIVCFYCTAASSMKNSCGEHVFTDNMLGRMEEVRY